MKQLGGKRTFSSEKPEERKVYRCPQCDFKAQHDSAVSQHVKEEHCPQTTCPFCNIGFITTEILGNHINEMHKENNADSTVHNCHNCDFRSQNSSMLVQHVKEVHSNQPSCPFCNVGFNSHLILRKHIDQMHKDITLPTVRQNIEVNKKKGPCAFFQKPLGCKKGLYCDFSHEQGSPVTLEKVRKLCRNGIQCSWKPRGKFVHVEDGEVIPLRASRDQVQDFVMPDLTQPPPNHQTTYPPRYNIASSTDFPGLLTAKSPQSLLIVQ